MRSLFYDRTISALFGMFLSVVVLFFSTIPAFAAQATLAWSNISSADGYRVFHRVSGGSFDYENPIWSGSNTTCSIENLADDTTHLFVVRSFSGTNQSENSNEVSFHFSPPVVTHTIKAIPGENGAIDPAGDLSITRNETQVFHITPAPGYQISDVRVDGVSVGAVASYTFATIDRNHTIEAVFAPITSNPLPPADQDSGNSEPIQTPANGSAIILDNGETGTRANGRWSVSDGTDAYGTGSIYSKETGADYAYEVELAGRFKVALWWSGYKSRCTNVPVEIYDGSFLLDTIYVDQSQNAGRWNVIGTYDFTGHASVHIVSESTDCSTAADAIRFTPNPRLQIIDDGDPGTSAIGKWSVSAGTEPFGMQSLYSKSLGASYNFESRRFGRHKVALWWSGFSSRCSNVPVEIYDGDVLLDTVYVDQTTGSGQWNALGVYLFNGIARVSIIADNQECSTSADAVSFFAMENRMIIDDGDPGTSSVGSWEVSGGSHPFGGQSLYSKKVDAGYTYTMQSAGSYDVELWWSGYPSRCSNVPVEIYDGNRLLEKIHVDQSRDSGQWNRIGTYDFSNSARITIVAGDGTCSTAADAVSFIEKENKIIDDGDPGTTPSGKWSLSGGQEPFGTQSLYSKQTGATYTYASPLDGRYDVQLWWSSYPSRCGRVPVEIFDGEKFLGRIYVDQTLDGGRWNTLGTYEFNGMARMKVVVGSSDCSTAADAAQFSKSN